MSWAFPDERTPDRQNILDQLLNETASAMTSPLWFFEVTNVLIMAERRKRLTQAQSTKFLELLQALPIDVSDTALEQVFSETASLARQHKLSAYDAAYLGVALEEGLPLASLDDALNKAAIMAGVALVQ
jgi:predicted nucleic acid-binding protein